MTDQELVELFWQRREEALTGLQDKYGGWCRSIAGRILGEERDVEECLQIGTVGLHDKELGACTVRI